MSVNDDLRDKAIRHAIYSERFGRGLAKRIVALLNAVDDDLTDQLQRRLERIATIGDGGPATTKGLNDLLSSIRVINDKVYRRVAEALEGELIDLAAFEIENQVSTLTRTVPVAVVATAPTAQVLRTLVTTTPIDGHLLKPWVDSMSANRLARVEQALRIGIAEGQTVDQLVRRVRGTRAKGYRDGILQISRRSAETLAITANSTIANAAREHVYRDNARLIRKLKWISTLDSRTSEVCQARDGRLYDLDKPHPTPPAHPRCRSVMIPVTVPFSALGLDAADYSPKTRASMDGQVPGDTSFGDWLSRQPIDRVEAVMGKRRAEMFATGKLKFSEFFNTDDEYYTLEELKNRSKSR